MEEGNGEKEVDADAESGTEPDPFSPASLARVTTALVRDALLPLRPTHVLIERQRFRSAGHAAVQEWTLRVNTLEAMLHAALRTVREYGLWDTSPPPPKGKGKGKKVRSNFLPTCPSRLHEPLLEQTCARCSFLGPK